MTRLQEPRAGYIEGLLDIGAEHDDVFVLDGDYGSSMRVSVRPAPGGMGTAVCVESMPKTAWISRFSTPTRVNAAFVAKERALRMKAKHLGGIAEAM